jgi:error-prone DNA polymerase
VTGYAELQVTSNYSFLHGASHIEELFAQAAAFGLKALGITDRNTLAGIVRAHQRAAETGPRLVVGCRLDLADGPSVLAYPTDRAAYARLCRLLTLGKGRAGHGNGCLLRWEDLAAGGDGLLAILVPEEADAALAASLARLRADFSDRAYLALTLRRRPGDAVRLRRLADLAEAADVPTIATGDVLYHAPERRILQDVLTCIREGCTIDEAGFRRERSADRHLKPPEEMARLFRRHPDALTRTPKIVIPAAAQPGRQQWCGTRGRRSGIRFRSALAGGPWPPLRRGWLRRACGRQPPDGTSPYGRRCRAGVPPPCC